MQKLYPKSVFAYIETLMSKGQLEITRFNDYGEILPMNRITLGDIEVVFMKSEHPKIPGYTAGKFMKEGIGKQYMEHWDQLPVKSHMLKDFRYLKKDEHEQIPYLELRFKDPNGKEKKALVRELFEIEAMDADDPEALEYYMKYADFDHNEKAYMVVKITDTENSYAMSEKSFLTNEIVNYDGQSSSFTPEDEENTQNQDTTALF